MMTNSVHGRVMGTEATVTVWGGGCDAGVLFDQLHVLESTWSRFRPGNELSRMHAAAGRVTVVSEPMFCLLEHLVAAHRLTGGRFDPTLGDQLAALGYDRTYRSLGDQPDPFVDLSRSAPPPPGVCDRIEMFRGAPAVLLPQGIRLDPGGLGKGLAADIVARSAIDGGRRSARRCWRRHRHPRLCARRRPLAHRHPGDRSTANSGGRAQRRSGSNVGLAGSDLAARR